MAHVTDQELVEYFEMIKDVEGDVMEIGVDRGYTFRRLIRHAIRQDRVPCALDSFCGMDEPGEFDDANYPKGKFDQGGVENFKSWMPFDNSFFKCFEGYIPICFEKYDAEHGKPLAFVVLDVDHYGPTVEGLEWVCSKISTGGILVLDDYFEGRREVHASRAIHEWVESDAAKDFELIRVTQGQIHFRKIS